MPLGIERINVRTAQPNPNINFIRPMDGPDKALAQDLLERVAAMCVPIMKQNHIYVMVLEDFPANNEFLGRNFNAGEKIQLVLKNRSGGWLPFKFVQRVMMHELAHCKQMNHSKFFWEVNNQHCAELTVLWEIGYTGEGMWSKGLSLATGNYVQDRPLAEGEIPAHLCGGAYRSNRKRKRGAPEKEKISYQERQQRRIAKKFGTNGVALGADDEVKARLENGKRTASKPRVAGSVRGRELRAAAALARFEKPQIPATSGDDLDDSETESDEEDIKIQAEDAKDIYGQRLTDDHGRGMVKVCEDDSGGEHARKEMEELRNLEYVYGRPKKTAAILQMQNLGLGQEQGESYKSPYAFGSSTPAQTSSFQDCAKSLREAVVPKRNEKATRSNTLNMVKREVFDILSDCLGDPTCNPEGALYSGLDAAKASRPALDPESAENSASSDDNDDQRSPHNGHTSGQTYMRTQRPPAYHVASSSSHTPASSLTSHERRIRDFARAVDNHRRADVIGLPPPPEPSMAGNNTHNSRGNGGPRMPPIQARPPATSVQASRPAPQPAAAPRAPALAPQPAPPPPPPALASSTCKICTTINDAESLVCMVCSNLLHPHRDPLHWRCTSAICKGTEYINSGDYGVCGVCQEKKPFRR